MSYTISLNQTAVAEIYPQELGQMVMTAAAVFEKDERVTSVMMYPEGFVPNSYKYRCMRTRYQFHRDGRIDSSTYDAKRSHGAGPAWVGLSAKGGRLISG